MKTKLILIILLSAILFSSCNDKKDEPDQLDVEKIEYYVKYELQTSSRYVYSTVDAQLVTEKGVVTMTIPRNWEGTFGPFTKLENIVFIIKREPAYTYNTTTFNGRISICKGNQPYILKSDKTISNAPLEMQYQITQEDLK